MTETGHAMDVAKLLGRKLNDVEAKADPGTIFVKGALEIPLPCPKVSVIGSREASGQGIENARKIVETLVENQVVIVSGLAKGIDTAAHETALERGGKTVAVIGTPLEKTYPKSNHGLQQELMRNHLVISQFPAGRPVTKGNFVMRNKTMALISDASVIVEAGEASGSRHQGWEALRMGRPLFIWESLINDDRLKWPSEMVEYGARELSNPTDILEVLPTRFKVINVFG